MSKTRFALGALAVCLLPIAVGAQAPASDWSFNATIIEACSCPMFCQCYFNAQPSAEHGGHDTQNGHFCRFNNAFRVNKGKYGKTALDGARFWVYGDLGGDFSKGQMDWAVVTFDKSLTKEQRDGIAAILAHVYPVKWNSLTTAEGAMDWTLGDKEAWATLDGGKTAEVRLSSASLGKNDGGKPTVLQNLKYWGVPRNDGFVMMPNTVEAVRKGEKTFEFNGTNGFLITIDMNSGDLAKKG
ncbi:MAG: DUF1326 domain-containing protein [bacterium]